MRTFAIRIKHQAIQPSAFKKTKFALVSKNL